MKLSDVMSHMDLATYPEVALVIFLVVFAALGYRLYRPSRRSALESAGRLPIDDLPIIPSDATERSKAP